MIKNINQTPGPSELSSSVNSEYFLQIEGGLL